MAYNSVDRLAMAGCLYLCIWMCFGLDNRMDTLGWRKLDEKEYLELAVGLQYIVKSSGKAVFDGISTIELE